MKSTAAEIEARRVFLHRELGDGQRVQHVDFGPGSDYDVYNFGPLEVEYDDRKYDVVVGGDHVVRVWCDGRWEVAADDLSVAVLRRLLRSEVDGRVRAEWDLSLLVGAVLSAVREIGLDVEAVPRSLGVARLTHLVLEVAARAKAGGAL